LRTFAVLCVMASACTPQRDVSGHIVDSITGDTIDVVDDDTAVVVRRDDALFARARVDGYITLPEFIDRFCNPPPLQTDLALKARFAGVEAHGDSVFEHLWLTVIAIKNGRFRAIVENSPAHAPGLKFKDTVVVDTTQISDWYAIQGDTLVAGFTRRALRSQLTAQGRARWDSVEGLIVLPDTVEWRLRGLIRADTISAGRLRSRLTGSCT
jgi:uncharacterized protein YegJ (DUF2314 family)